MTEEVEKNQLVHQKMFPRNQSCLDDDDDACMVVTIVGRIVVNHDHAGCRSRSTAACVAACLLVDLLLQTEIVVAKAVSIDGLLQLLSAP
jgi:hypothetical protein